MFRPAWRAYQLVGACRRPAFLAPAELDLAGAVEVLARAGMMPAAPEPARLMIKGLTIIHSAWRDMAAAEMERARKQRKRG